MTDGHHIHPRPRGDLVLCDGRCGARFWLEYDADAATADARVAARGWLVTKSMVRSFHFCGACAAGRAPVEPQNDFLRRQG